MSVTYIPVSYENLWHSISDEAFFAQLLHREKRLYDSFIILALKGDERAQAILDCMRAFIDRYNAATAAAQDKIRVDWSRVNEHTRALRMHQQAERESQDANPIH